MANQQSITPFKWLHGGKNSLGHSEALGRYAQMIPSEALTKGMMERETGIEPATNSLEGCDSTIELLPPFGFSSLQHVKRCSEAPRPNRRYHSRSKSSLPVAR